MTAIFPMLAAMIVPADAFWDRMQAAADADHALLVAIAFFALALVLLRARSVERSSVRSAAGLFSFAIILLMLSHVARWTSLEELAVALRAAGLMVGGVAIVNELALLLFNVALESIRIRSPKILRDLVSLLGYIGVAMWLMRQGGMSLSNIVTTSAVLTAVIGFSLQDTLGNIMGGLALQMEKTINEGDWVQVGQLQGKVKEIRWRHTSIETRNWDTVVIPNSMLMKGEVMILGRRTGQPIQHRMWVYFNVDFRVPPAEVIALVENALRLEAIPNVAQDPPPNCITWLYKESYIEYAVRYWLTDLQRDDPTNSEVRVRIYYALKRAGIPLSIPAQQLFITEDHQHREHHEEREIAHRVETLSRVELFHTMTVDELHKLALRLSVAPFTTGEAMTRQGAEAHWLYVITKGSGEVLITADGGLRKTVAKLAAGDFFGEIGMMTGSLRNATVLALEPTECYRLDKASFQDILSGRPEIAEHISHVIARRSVELEAVRDNLSAEARARMLQPAQQDIFDRMASLFGFGAAAKGAKAN
ncbi:MAG: cyclic nucleotide-binding domain-containing protein [Terriglobales bacterium]